MSHLLRVKCAAPGCLSRGENSRMYAFPVGNTVGQIERYNIWADIIGRPELKLLRPKMYLCWDHFEDRQFMTKDRYSLVRGATPSKHKKAKPAIKEEPQEHDAVYSESVVMDCMGNSQEDIDPRSHQFPGGFAKLEKSEQLDRRDSTFVLMKPEEICIKGEEMHLSPEYPYELSRPENPEGNSNREYIPTEVLQSETVNTPESQLQSRLQHSRGSKCKIETDEHIQDAYAIMKELSQRNFQDNYSEFLENVSIKLRNLKNPSAVSMVQHIINTCLFEAEIGMYDDISNPSGLARSVLPNNLSPCSTSFGEYSIYS